MKTRWIYFSLSFAIFLSALYPVYRMIKKMPYGTPDVAIHGPVVMADGIGRQTVELAKVLAKKHKVKIFSNHVDKTDLPSGIMKMIKARYKKQARIVIVEESLWAPGNRLDRFFPNVESEDQIRFAYTMLESTRIIPEWVMMINLYFDAVIVPDIFLVDAYKRSGVTIPIFHIPLGLDLEEFLQAPLKVPKDKGPIVFACLGSGIDRKNLKTAIQAFAKALGNNENAILHINCRTALPEIRDEIIAEIIKQGCSNIKYTEVCLKKDAYLKFFKSIDCLLSLSKGEGFSIQPREAMALGIPVIVTDNTAQSTICKSGLAKVVNSLIAEPRHYFGRKLSDGEHFNCNVDDAANAIRDVYLNYRTYADYGPMMRKWASAYNYKNLASIYESLVNPPKLILGNANEITADYIMTDSKLLYDKYLRLSK